FPCASRDRESPRRQPILPFFPLQRRRSSFSPSERSEQKPAAPQGGRSTEGAASRILTQRDHPTRPQDAEHGRIEDLPAVMIGVIESKTSGRASDFRSRLEIVERVR